MKRAVGAVVAAAPPTTVQAPPRDGRAVATDLAHVFRTRKDPARAVARCVAPDHVRPDPEMADGRDAALRLLVPSFARPGAAFEARRVLVDGDLAAIHRSAHGRPGGRGPAAVDPYRRRQGKLVEHRDVLQGVPGESANPHPMF